MATIERAAIAKIAVWNDGTGDHTHGNYIYMISTEHDPRWGAPGGVIDDQEFWELIWPYALVQPGGDFRDDRIIANGAIRNYPRKNGSLGLLAKVLEQAGFVAGRGYE